MHTRTNIIPLILGDMHDTHARSPRARPPACKRTRIRWSRMPLPASKHPCVRPYVPYIPYICTYDGSGPTGIKSRATCRCRAEPNAMIFTQVLALSHKAQVLT